MTLAREGKRKNSPVLEGKKHKKLLLALKRANAIHRDFWKEAAYARLTTEQRNKEALRTPPENSLLFDLFERAQLPTQDPMSWRILVEILLEVYVGKTGAPKKWDLRRYNILYLDAEIAASGLPSKARTPKNICSLLMKQAPYQKIGLENMKKYLRAARKKWSDAPIQFFSSDDYKTRMALIKRS